MTPFLTKLRQFTGWALIIVSTALMFVSIFVATTGDETNDLTAENDQWI